MKGIDPVSSAWIPEDDLLLKNSVEAGASLEALAKGAVQFSRGYTLRELRERWHSLLYDPDVSARASARMVEFELSGSNPLAKFSRLDTLKGSEKAPEKRKGGSIRKQYYAMRKRMKNEFFNSADLGFFEKCNNHNFSRDGHNFQGHVTHNHDAQVGDVMLGDCLANNLGFEETDFEILRQAFPETIGSIAATAVVDKSADAFHTEGCHKSFENDYINGSMRDGLYKLTEDVRLPLENDGSFDPGFEPKNATHMHKGDSDNFVKCIGSEELGTTQTLPSGKRLKTDESEAKLVSTYDSMNENGQILCSGFGGKQHSNSPGSDGSASFHSMGFSSPLPRMPLWRTMEDVSAPDMPVDENNAESNQVAEETLASTEEGDLRRESSPGYDACQSVPLLGDKHDGTDFINSSAVPEGEYTDLPDSLLNFSNEDDILYMDVVAKDAMDEVPDSQLPDSTKDVPEDALCSADATTLLVTSTSLATPSIQCHEESKDSSFHGDLQDVCHWEVDVPSTSISHPDPLQLSEGKIICTLNTEDPEIPCNDDIFLLIHPSTSFAPSVGTQIAADSIDPLSSSADEKDGEQGLSAVKNPALSFTRSQVAGQNLSSEFVSAHSHVDYAFKSEISDAKCSGPLSGQPDKLRNPGHSRSVHANPVLIGDRALTEDGLDTSAIYREMSFRPEVGSLKMNDPESMDNPSISDHNNSDSDGDIPYLSDIEAMILEMDLAYAQESCITSEVARYQYDHSKRTIIRLEQTARSSLQRSMSSRGALAIFYGRHLNYYIKKTEVTIGRSTDDTDVDIDLRKEGRANMISRRQATIKMDTDGSFTLKNLGKSSFSMNGNSIAHGMVAALGSSSLIEIKGMSFVFEINDKYVRRYLDNIMKKSQGKSRTFEWSPEGEP